MAVSLQAICFESTVKSRALGCFAAEAMMCCSWYVTRLCCLAVNKCEIIPRLLALQVNGEKASPAILEDAFRASFLVQDAVVFGSNRPALGALIVPSAPKNQISQSDLQELLNNVNRLAPAHAQIPPELLVLLKPEDTFPRASKGSLQRSRAYAAYAATIDQAYDSYKSSEVTTSPQQLDLHGERLLQHLGQLVHQAMGLDASESIDTNADLFTQGLNSLQSVRIRNVLQNVSLASLVLPAPRLCRTLSLRPI